MTSLVGRLCSSLYRAGSRRLPVAYTSTSSIIFQKGKVKPLDDPSTGSTHTIATIVTSFFAFFMYELAIFHFFHYSKGRVTEAGERTAEV